jgi:hypothetical protein
MITLQAADPGLLDAALRLHAYLERRHLHGNRLEGPDQGVRWNIRLWRFLPRLGPEPRYFFLQGQGYWALANGTLAELTGDARYSDLARGAVEAIAAAQREDGAWDYPLPERKHLVATVEGNWAAVAMLEAGAGGLGKSHIAAARRWHDYVEREIGYQQHASGLAVNYFQKPRGLVPNNSAEWIWVLGRFARVTGETHYLQRVPALLDFLAAVQRPDGELPYELAGTAPEAGSGAPNRTRLHYLCYQYNAFQCIKLAWYAHEHGDARARAIAVNLARFIAGGVTESGAVRASCGSRLPEVIYYSDSVAMALHTVTQYGWADHRALAGRAYAWVRSRQRPDGGFDFSRGDYYLLSDRASYPRYLAITLFHLAARARGPGAR